MDLYNALLQNYISYDTLFALTHRAIYEIDNIDKSEINLFIDLNSYTKQMFNNPHYEYKNANVLTASIINACAHYRNYFWTRHMCKTNIYLVWGWNTSPYFPYPNYNAHYLQKVQTCEAMDDQSIHLISLMKDQLKFLCPYLPQIYFVDGGMNEAAVVIYSLAREYSRNLPNVILSKDIYAYQLVVALPITFIYRPKKIFMDNIMHDSSWVVMKKNLFKAYRHEMHYAQSNENKPIPDVYFANLSLVHSLSGMTKRHVKGICSFNQACRELIRLLPEAAEMKCDVYQLEVAMQQSRKYPLYNPSMIFPVLDIESNANAMIQTPDWITMKEGITDLYNPQGVMEISDKEFAEYPLELGEL